MNTEQVAESLLNSGMVVVPYPHPLRIAVEKAHIAWRGFCALPLEIKKQFTYNATNAFDSSGYEHKPTPGTTQDLKENFHVNLREMLRLNTIASSIPSATVARFIVNAQVLFEHIDIVITELAFNLQEGFNLPGLVNEVVRNKDHWILRFLHYFGGANPGDEIAKAHADTSGITLHLFESDPGLEYLHMQRTGNQEGLATGTRKWLPMPVSEGQTVIIINLQMQFKTEGRLKALCHRVVATEETAKNGRFSMVLFVPLMYTAKFDKSKVGRQQDLPAGYNYDMPHWQFSKFFT